MTHENDDSFESLHAALRHTNERVQDLRRDISSLDLRIESADQHQTEESGRLDRLERRVHALERGRLAAPFGQAPTHAFELQKPIDQALAGDGWTAANAISRSLAEALRSGSQRLTNRDEFLVPGELLRRVFDMVERANENTVEGGGSPGVSEQTPRPADRSAVEVAPSTASPASVPECPYCSGKLSLWMDDSQGCKWGRAKCVACDVLGPEVRTGYDASGATWLASAGEELTRLASRAPRASPQPSVEEMAERLRSEHEDKMRWDAHPRWYWIALARAALSAMPAPDAPKPEEVARIDAIRAKVEPIFAPKPAREAQGDTRLSAKLTKMVKDRVADWRSDSGNADAEDLAWSVAMGALAVRYDHAREAQGFSVTDKELVAPYKREAQGEPTLEECLKVAETACHKAWANGLDGYRARISAVRDLCLASRAPSPSPALDATTRLVLAADDLRSWVVDVHEPHIPPVVDVYDRARAALPKEAK